MVCYLSFFFESVLPIQKIWQKGGMLQIYPDKFNPLKNKTVMNGRKLIMKKFFLIINSALLYYKKEDYNIKIRET